MTIELFIIFFILFFVLFVFGEKNICRKIFRKKPIKTLKMKK